MAKRAASSTPNLCGHCIAVRYHGNNAKPDQARKIAKAAGICDSHCRGTAIQDGADTIYIYETHDHCLEAGEDHESILEKFRQDSRVDYVAQCLETDTDLVFDAPSVLVDSDTASPEDVRDQLNGLSGFEAKVMDGCCCVTKPGERIGHVDDIVEKVKERAKLASLSVSVRPNRITLYRAYQPSDEERAPCDHPGEPDQDAFKLINAYKAQRMVPDGNRPRIAIIDSGVEERHPDLPADENARFYDSVRKVHGGSMPVDAHGTACAGIALAKHDGKGIHGIAPNSDLVGIKFVELAVEHTDSSNRWKLDPVAIAHAIRYAWDDAKADVLSFSWGWHLYRPEHYPILEAISEAVELGRNRKGCVVIAAAGNEDINFVMWPASMSNVIAVGATTLDGRPKRWSVEEPWGTNSGAALNVMAPGIRIATTDLTGNKGYGPGDYIKGFKGTSAATPVVAGVAALVLATNPGLTSAEVQHILESTADKTGDFEYDSRGHSASMGYGLVNAERAVQAASRGRVL